MKSVSPLSAYQKRIQKAYFLLCRNLDHPLDMAALAKEAAFSLYHFHRIYRNLVGETVAETHRRLRLERAAGMIVKNSHSITHIALDAGYETPQAFSRAFKSQFSLSPAAYRKLCHKDSFIQHVTISGLLFKPILKETVMENIVIEERPAVQALVVEHIGPYMQIGKAFDQLWQWVIANNLLSRVECGMGIYYDDPMITPAEKCRSDACVIIKSPNPDLPDFIRTIDIPAGHYARYRVVGPYSNLEQAYGVFFSQWLPTSGYECDHFPPFEVYVNDPHQTGPQDLITDIYVKIKEK